MSDMEKYLQIKEIGRVITGKTPSTEDDSNFDGKYPFITPSDIKSFDEKYLLETERTLSEQGAKKLKNNILPKDAICFVCIGSTIGKMCLTNTIAYSNQQINSLIVNNNFDAHYMFYFLRYVKSYFQQLGAGTGSGKGIVNKATFEKSKVKVETNKNIQVKIADILSAYDNLIENNNKRIKLLEQMAENLYKEWFVRFRFPGHEDVEFEEDIPSNWNYIQLSDIISFERGISYSSAEINCDDGINLVNLKNIQSYGGFRREGKKIYNGKYKDSQIVKTGDLILGVTDMTQDRRTVGAVALMPVLDGTSVISADLVKIESQVPNQFLYCMCKYGFYSKYFSQFANGANVLHLKPNTLLNKKILLPTEDLIETFTKKVKPMINIIDKINLQNDILIKQRDLLLPRLMSGKLEV